MKEQSGDTPPEENIGGGYFQFKEKIERVTLSLIKSLGWQQTKCFKSIYLSFKSNHHEFSSIVKAKHIKP